MSAAESETGSRPKPAGDWGRAESVSPRGAPEGTREKSGAKFAPSRTTALQTPALTRLSLANYRSYRTLDLTLDERPVALSGPNGAGKTNLLEAVSYLSPGRGLRGAAFADVLARGADAHQRAQGWAVSAKLRLGTDEGRDEVRLGTGYAAGKRSVRIDGEAAAGPGVLGEYLSMVWLTPAMDRLFLESPGGRRRFFDRLVLSLFPRHGARAAAYEKAARERARLLKDGVRDADWLGGLESAMVEHGLALAEARAAYLQALKQAGDAAESETGSEAAAAPNAFPRADLALKGRLEGALAEGVPSPEIAQRFARDLAYAREADASAGRTTVGPQRTDLIVHHRGKGVPARDCSTGEQKALLIGLVLANARLVRDREARAPLLLLDEIAAHLDAVRRAALFDEICALGAQAWMTGTDASLFEALGPRAQQFQVADGAVEPLPGTIA